MFVTMRDIGTMFGVSSHVIGRWLVAIGLRTIDKRPSPAAHHNGYVEQCDLQNGGYFYRWHRDMTVAALEQAGHKPVVQRPAQRITGPFSMVESGPNAYQIRSGDGMVAIWVIGQHNADIVTRLLNLAYKHGRLGEQQ